MAIGPGITRGLFSFSSPVNRYPLGLLQVREKSGIAGRFERPEARVSDS
jgi:hypothetical protein